MHVPRRIALCGLILCGLAAAQDAPAPKVRALHRAHAHNDYRHDRPLLDALDRGFAGVEADIFLQDGRLLVGHDLKELTPERTLEALYLRPLADRVAQNDGQVYPDGSGLTLLIDIKADGPAVYEVLDALLSRYAAMLTSCENGTVLPRAVTAVISGDCPRDLVEKDPTRYAGIDGRLGDLDSALPAALLPLISDRWGAHFQWQGLGPMPDAERKELERIVAEAHDKGRRVRFWATPDVAGPRRRALWQVLWDCGVDLINTDDLDGLQAFIQGAGTHP